MELELVQKGDHELTVKIEGEDHTFCNLLRSALLEDQNVISASYAVEHPLLEPPKFHVRVKRGSPARALLKAVQGVMEDLGRLREGLLKALKTK